MSKQVTVYYALQSPWTYLGWARLRELVARTGAAAQYRPIQSGPMFEASGTLPLAKRPKQRQAYRLMELRRWRDHLGVPLNLHPKHFPVDESRAARMAIAHRQRGGDIAALSQAMMTAVWAEERDLADRATLLEIAREQGAGGPAAGGGAGSGRAERVRCQHSAGDRTGRVRRADFVIGDELFWGQDRLDFVARSLA